MIKVISSTTQLAYVYKHDNNYGSVRFTGYFVDQEYFYNLQNGTWTTKVVNARILDLNAAVSGLDGNTLKTEFVSTNLLSFARSCPCGITPIYIGDSIWNSTDGTPPYSYCGGFVMARNETEGDIVLFGTGTGQMYIAGYTAGTTTLSFNTSATSADLNTYKTQANSLFAPYSHPHSSLNGYVASITNPTTTAGQLMYGYNLNAEYCGTLPKSNNANGIMTINTHAGNYHHQLGFSSNNNLYHRAVCGTDLSDSVAWNKIMTSANFSLNGTTLTITT